MVGCRCRSFLQGLGHVNSRAIQGGLRQATCFPAIQATPEITTGILGVRYAAKPSVKQSKQPTRLPSHRIGVTRSWDSIHTGNLKGSYWASERMLDDIMIRKFVDGVMHNFLNSQVVIKRRANYIILVFLVSAEADLTKFYFLMGFTERLLTQLLGCIVKIEPQSAYKAE